MHHGSDSFRKLSEWDHAREGHDDTFLGEGAGQKQQGLFKAELRVWKADGRI